MILEFKVKAHEYLKSKIILWNGLYSYGILTTGPQK